MSLLKIIEQYDSDRETYIRELHEEIAKLKAQASRETSQMPRPRTVYEVILDDVFPHVELESKKTT